MMRPLATFSFFIFFNNFFISFHSPRPSFLSILPSSPSLLPPRLSFLPVSPSSSSLLPPRPSFFLSQHCLNHLKSVKVHFSSILTKALRTDGPTNQPMDKPAYRDADASLKVVQTVQYSSCSICSLVLRSLQERMQSSRAASAELGGGISPRQNTDVAYVFKIGTSCTFFILRS